MKDFRRIAVGEDARDAVTVGIERNPEGGITAVVWWPSRGDIDADEATYSAVPDAIAAAEAACELHGFAEVVVALQSDDLWDSAWGKLSGLGLTEAESYELAWNTEASRDA